MPERLLPSEQQITVSFAFGFTKKQFERRINQSSQADFSRYSTIDVAAIAFGSKVLKLNIKKGGVFSSYVETQIGLTHQENETTRCYLKLKQLLQHISDLLGRAIQYQFTTYNETMKSWVATTGQDLFSFYEFYEQDDELIASTQINPRERKRKTRSLLNKYIHFGARSS